jgi:hypothetical protein
VKGKHQLKIGVDQRWIRENWINKSLPSGQFNLRRRPDGRSAAPRRNGRGMATYLLGQVTGGSLAIRNHMSFHAWSFAGYIQDDFKVTPLTLNLGLRYDLRSTPVERGTGTRTSTYEPTPQTRTLGLLTYADVTRAAASWTATGPTSDRAGFATH